MRKRSTDKRIQHSNLRRHSSLLKSIIKRDINSNTDDDDDESATISAVADPRYKKLLRNVFTDYYKDKSRHRPLNAIIIGYLTLGFLLIILIATLFYKEDEVKLSSLHPPDPEVPLPPSWSLLKTFRKGAICVDNAECALIGKSVLEKNGSAVDAALSALICNGLMNMQSMGLGGGFLMTIYDKKSRKTVVLNAREMAPLQTNEHMFDNTTSKSNELGPLSIAVPGELAGYWEAHRRYGKLPWSSLFEPSIQICETGFNLTKGVYDDLLNNKDKIFSSGELKAIFVDPNKNEFWTPGSTIKPHPELCKTLKLISQESASEFYQGELGERLVEDVQNAGGILTMEDMKNYRVKWEHPVYSQYLQNLTLYSPGLPGSGPLIIFILNILEGFKFNPDSISDISSMVQTYHRVIESFKYTYAIRTKLGDPDFIDTVELQKKLVSKEYAKMIRSLISDNETHNDPSHYGFNGTANIENHGTTHVSVLHSNGDAVSVTSSINIYFGSGIVSKQTGILLNSGMDDFGVPLKLNYHGIPASPANFIKAGKRSLSSMAPTILVDSNDNVQMVIGAAGGTKITTSIALVLMRYLWMSNNLKEAIDSPRIHHQLFPMKVTYEYGVLNQVLDGLRQLGHKTSRYRHRGSVINSIVQQNNVMYANVDYRKSSGNAYGLD